MEAPSALRTPLETLSLYRPHNGTIADLIASRAAFDPVRPCLLFGDRTWSWRDLEAEVERTARMLVGRGVGKGDRVGVMATNSDAYVVLFCALARIGAITVGVNSDFVEAEARYVFEHAGVCAIACTSATIDIARNASDGLSRRPWLLLLEGDDGATQTLRQLVEAAPQVSLPDDVSSDDTCAIIYTSGTTGFPKGVMHSQRACILAGEGFVERMHLQPEDRLLCVLPLFHINALLYSLHGALAAGASIVLTPRFSASGFWALAASSGATEVNILAAVGSILARRPRSEYVASHRLTKVYGAATTPEVFEVFERDFGVRDVIEGYGMTEVPGACNQPFAGLRKPGSMGVAARHPDGRRFAELRVVDEAGAGVADDLPGELLVRTPLIMQGYYRDPVATAAAFRDGWFCTGDIVRRDADGYYYFVARKNDVIRRRGENVAGAELDRVIGEHPDVAEAAAIAVPSDLGEDEILVAVVPKPGAALAAAEVAAWCQGRLSPGKRPRYVVLVDELPHTPTHRIAKFQLDKAELLSKAVDLVGEA
jgi:crotonobetaine/carnitine-CoA ligase